MVNKNVLFGVELINYSRDIKECSFLPILELVLMGTHIPATTAQSSKEWSQKNPLPISSDPPPCLLFLPLFPPLYLSLLFPPVLALSAESFYFSLSEWTGPISPLFNERVVFSCSAHSQNTPFPHWQLSGKRMTLYERTTH